MSLYMQKLDRAWYDFDGGYDETNNPFADIPEEYTKKKEEQLAKHAVKRMSAQQRQINKVSLLSLSLSLSRHQYLYTYIHVQVYTCILIVHKQHIRTLYIKCTCAVCPWTWTSTVHTCTCNYV